MAIEYWSWGEVLARLKELEDKLDASIRSYFDPFEDAVASPVASEHWTGEVYVGSAEDSDADINTTTSGKAYVIADPDTASPAATGYWLRKNKTINASHFTVIVDADFTWGTAGAGNLFGGLWITKGAAYDANNILYIARLKSTTGSKDIITADGVLNGSGLTGVEVAITDDAVAFKIERWNDQWRFYYSLTQSPDYNWVFVEYFEDTSNYMTDEVSIALQSYSPGNSDANSLQVDYDNYKFYVNTASIDEMLSEGYNSAHISAAKDGGIMERQEYIMGLIQAGGGGGGGDVGGAETGDTYYVSTTGSDSTGNGSNSFPWATIDYAMGQCTADNDDKIVLFPGTYDENANTNGVICDVGGVTVVGNQEGVNVVNSNASATSVFDITGSGVTLKNLNITETTTTVEGVVGSGTGVVIYDCAFTAAMENGIHSTGNNWKIEYCSFSSMTNDAIELEGTGNIVRYNTISVPTDNGISAIAGSDNNLIYANIINGENATTNGINIAADDNFCPLNEVANCTNELVDSGTRNFFGESSTGGTKRPDDASVWDWIGGANGLPTFPAAATVANGISLGEVIRRIVENQTPLGAAWSVQMFNQTANANLETTWEQWLTTWGIDGTNVFTDINNVTPASVNGIFQAFAALWGADGANVFNPTIFGAARTDLELALANLAVYFSPAGAAWAVQMNNATADASLEETWEEYTRVVGVDGANQLTNINNTANLTFDAVWQQFAALWGADGANVFNPTIFGSARTTLEAALQNLALYFSVSSAAWSVQMNNATADASLEDTWEEWTRVVGVDGANQFTNINNSANLTMDSIFQKFAALWGADGANVFSVTVGGTAYVNLETALQAISDQIASTDELDAKTGATYYVSTAGNDGNTGTLYDPWLTIDYAVGMCTADNDDQIVVLPGAYDENANTGGVVVDVAGITIRGVQPTADQQVTTVVNSNGSATAVFTVSANNVTIQDLAIIETTATVEGIVSSGSYCLFQDLQLSGAMENGIHLAAATQNTIKDCNIFGQTNDGIEISGASIHNIVDGGLIGLAGDNGVHFNGDGADQNVVRNIEILGAGTTTNGIHINGGDNNMINGNTEINNCAVGVLIAAGSVSNTISASITCTTDFTDNSGVASNTLNGSLTNLHHETRHIEKFSGEIWYVDGTGGLDTNSGGTPDLAFATIGAAIAAASAGDRIQVKAQAAKYNENGLDMNLQGLELVFEEGALLEDTTPGTVLTISATDCRLVNVYIDNDDNGGVGFDATTAASVWMQNCTAQQCTVGFQLDGVKGRFDNCVAIDNSTTGFDIQTLHAVYRGCVANGNNAAVRGFYLSDNTADLNAFLDCHSLGNTTAGWETVAGADNNLFTRCSSSGTDGTRVDAGTNNSWPGMLEGTDLPIDKSTYDIIGTNYVDGGGAFNLDSIGDDFNTLGTYVIDGTPGAEAGTTLAAGKSLIDALGTDGTTPIDTATSVLGAIGVNDADNAMDTSAVVANNDGSVFERLEGLLSSRVTKRTFFSDSQALVTIPAGAADQALPSVVLPNETIGTLLRVTCGFKFRETLDTSGVANKLSGAQDIQVKESAAGTFTDCINLQDDMWKTDAGGKAGGDVLVGDIDVKAEVDAMNATYDFQIDEAVADGASLELHDVQTFIILEYTS
jgi:hypothetical protein